MRQRPWVVGVLAVVLGLICSTTLRAEWPISGTVISDAGGSQPGARITTDGAGGAIITWSDGPIYAQRIDACGNVLWTTNGVVINDVAGSKSGPEITTDGAGGAIISWNDRRAGIENSDIYAQRIDENGSLLWAASGVVICDATGMQWYNRIAADGAGGAIVTWPDARSGDYGIYAQRIDANGTVQWTANGVVAGSSPGEVNPQRPKVTTDGAGGAIIAWGWFVSDVINAQRIDASGTVQWSPNGELIGQGGSPELITDGTGGAIITWDDNAAGASGGIYAQRIDASGTAQWSPGGELILAGDHVTPLLTPDGAGGAIITWQDRSGGFLQDDIRAQRINAGGVLQWSAGGAAVCTAQDSQFLGDIATDGAGGAIITWRDFRSDDVRIVPQDVYAQRILASGVVEWRDDGQIVCTPRGEQYSPQLAADGSNGAIITWTDQKSFFKPIGIYAQRIKRVWCAGEGGTGKVDLRISKTSEVSTAPQMTGISAIYPNPFNPSTTVDVSVASPEIITLRIYDARGRLVRVLKKEGMPIGIHPITWDGRDSSGSQVTAGVYFVRLVAGSHVVTKKAVMLR